MDKKRTLFVIWVSILSLAVGLLIGSQIPYHRPRVVEVVKEIPLQEKDQLTEWEILQLATIKTESDFNYMAKGATDDIGIFQITPIYVEEVNRLLGREEYSHSDALDPEKSVIMYKIIQEHKNPKKDISKAINIHNPGGNSIGYSIRVRNNMDYVRRYEHLRKLIHRNPLSDTVAPKE